MTKESLPDLTLSLRTTGNSSHLILFLLILIYLCGEGNGNPLQYSCPENSMGRGARLPVVHGVTKSQTQLSDSHTHTLFMTAPCSMWELGSPTRDGTHTLFIGRTVLTTRSFTGRTTREVLSPLNSDTDAHLLQTLKMNYHGCPFA